MNVLSQTLNSFSTQISEGGVSLNTDIFEANLINLLILGGALSDSLSERKEKILGAIQESEERLQEATERLTESEKQLEQAQMVIESIGKDAEVTAKQVKSAILTDGKTEIERLTAAAKSQIGTIEARVRKQISDYVVTLALKRITTQLEGKLTSGLQQKIIDRNISKLAE
jgi:F0F1-type ATP synthase membrane subunit b/b'